MRRMEQGRPGIGGGEGERNLQFYLFCLQFPPVSAQSHSPGQYSSTTPISCCCWVAIANSNAAAPLTIAFSPPFRKAPSSPLPSRTSASIFLPFFFQSASLTSPGTLGPSPLPGRRGRGGQGQSPPRLEGRGRQIGSRGTSRWRERET